MMAYYGDLFENWEMTIVRGMVAEFEKDNTWLRYPGHKALLQESFSHWYFMRGRFNPEKGASIKTYMRRVVSRRLNDIRKKEWAEKRRENHFTVPLDVPISDSGAFLKDVIPDDRTPEADDLRRDVERVMSKLNPFQQQICRLLGHGYSVREAERKLGKSKSSIYEEKIKLRQIFANEGLREYLR